MKKALFTLALAAIMAGTAHADQWRTDSEKEANAAADNCALILADSDYTEEQATTVCLDAFTRMSSGAQRESMLRALIEHLAERKYDDEERNKQLRDARYSAHTHAMIEMMRRAGRVYGPTDALFYYSDQATDEEREWVQQRELELLTTNYCVLALADGEYTERQATTVCHEAFSPGENDAAKSRVFLAILKREAMRCSFVCF